MACSGFAFTGVRCSQTRRRKSHSHIPLNSRQFKLDIFHAKYTLIHATFYQTTTRENSKIFTLDFSYLKGNPDPILRQNFSLRLDFGFGLRKAPLTLSTFHVLIGGKTPERAFWNAQIHPYMPQVQIQITSGKVLFLPLSFVTLGEYNPIQSNHFNTPILQLMKMKIVFFLVFFFSERHTTCQFALPLRGGGRKSQKVKRGRL